MKLYSTSEAAEELGLTRHTVHYHVISGNLPARKVGKTWVIRRTDLMDFKVERDSNVMVTKGLIAGDAAENA